MPSGACSMTFPDCAPRWRACGHDRGPAPAAARARRGFAGASSCLPSRMDPPGRCSPGAAGCRHGRTTKPWTWPRSSPGSPRMPAWGRATQPPAHRRSRAQSPVIVQGIRTCCRAIRERGAQCPAAFSDGGGYWSRVTRDPDGGEGRVAIVDHGPGINRDRTWRRSSRPFFRGAGARVRRVTVSASRPAGSSREFHGRCGRIELSARRTLRDPRPAHHGVNPDVIEQPDAQLLQESQARPLRRSFLAERRPDSVSA